MARDPIGEWYSINLFGFVDNQAMFDHDVLGLAEDQVQQKSLAQQLVECDCVETEIDQMAALLTKMAAKEALRHPIHVRGFVKPFYFEYCGAICCETKTRKVYPKGPVQGHFRHEKGPGIEDFNQNPIEGTPTCEKAFDEDRSVLCNPGDKLVRRVHSHPYANEIPEFSPGDENFGRCIPLTVANLHKKSPILMTCNGQLYQINPLTGERTKWPKKE